MTDDIVTRLRAWAEWGDNKRSTSPIKNPFTDSWATVSLEAADEIERLRTALALAVGELSTHARYSVYSPEQLMQQFLEDARHD